MTTSNKEDDQNSPENLESERLGNVLNAMGAMAGRRASDRHSTITAHQPAYDRLEHLGRIEWRQIAEDGSLRITQQTAEQHSEGIEITAVFNIVPDTDTDTEHLELADTEHSFTMTVPDLDRTNAYHYYDITQSQDGTFSLGEQRTDIDPDDLAAFERFAVTMNAQDAAAFATREES